MVRKEPTRRKPAQKTSPRKRPTTRTDATGPELALDATPVSTHETKQPAETSKRPAPRQPAAFHMVLAPMRTQVFLANGLIFPAIYDKAKTANQIRDSQSAQPAVITLLNERPAPQTDELVLDILLTPDEIADATPLPNGLQLHWPLPLSRLLKIAIPPAAGTPEKYTAGWIEPDVPVPCHLFDTLDTSVVPLALTIPADTATQTPQPKKDVAEAIANFNKYMGLFAYLRNGGRYFSETQGQYTDYPATFFALAALLTDHFGNPLDDKTPPQSLVAALLDLDATIAPALKPLVSLVADQPVCIAKDSATALARELYTATGSNEQVGQAFKALFATGDYKTAIQLLQGKDIPHEHPILATLYKFSNRQSNDHLTIKQRFHTDWTDIPTAMETLATLGAYYGYNMLNARETKLYAVHPQMASLVEPAPPIKFHLTTRFERQLIESLYQWAFYHRRAENELLRMYESIRSPETRQPARPRGVFVEDNPCTVEDLTIHRYTITWLGRLLQRFRNLPGDTLTDASHVGRYLYRDCADHPDAEKTRKRGSSVSRYSIPKERVIDLIAEGKIEVPERVFEALLEEDSKGTAK